jgi:hypothetical protein
MRTLFLRLYLCSLRYVHVGKAIVPKPSNNLVEIFVEFSTNFEVADYFLILEIGVFKFLDRLIYTFLGYNECHTSFF